MTIALTQLIVCLFIAVVSAELAAAMFGHPFPNGFLGSLVAALLGEWIMINLLHGFALLDVSYTGIPIITTVMGSLAFSFFWAAVTSRRDRSRNLKTIWESIFKSSETAGVRVSAVQPIVETSQGESKHAEYSAGTAQSFRTNSGAG